ncbi:Anaphase-promoting complex subunit 4 [Mortierella sp. AM989]|nr:Anaphase-promoting complex subunit 4 [Mortierella sp. AM989]
MYLGKMIAVGLRNGQVNVYDYRDGSLAYTITPPDQIQAASDDSTKFEAIGCLKWADVYLGRPMQTAFFGAHQFPRSILEALPLLSPIPLTSTQQQIMMVRSMFNKNHPQLAAGSGSSKDVKALAEKMDEPDEESSDIMNILFIGDNKGRFKLRLFGGFETGPVSLLELLGLYGVKDLKSLNILKADIQLDLSEITVIVLGSCHPPTVAESEQCGQLVLQVTITSELLYKHSREIRVLGLKKRPVNNLLNYLSDGLQVMQAEFRKVHQLAQDCVESIQQSLDDNGEMTTPTYEFLQLLMTGHPSPSLDKYLQQDLRRHGLRRWDKSAKTAYGGIQRVAFECLLPACEQLLIHLSDILGCGRWDERYKPLELKEALIYNCIKIVGDFMGMLERLFSVLKAEMKQFHEFENWLEHVLELLQPTIRDDEQGDDTQRKFPPIDYAGVSEFLQSGLNSKNLESFFHDMDEHDKDIDPALNAAEMSKDEDTLLGYDLAPSYPMVYSFSEEVQGTVRTEAKRFKKETADPATQESSQIQAAGSKNPFAGPALIAALANRGFIPPPRSTPPKALPLDPKQRPPLLTLERHLQLMTKHCLSIFKGPAEAVARSMKVFRALDLLGSKLASSEAGDVKPLSGPFQVATRYCYHDLKPWHYLALYLKRSENVLEPALCILRTRKDAHLEHSSTMKHNEAATSTLSADDASNVFDGRGSPPLMSRLTSVPAAMLTRLGKRRASNPDVLSVPSSGRARTRSPARTPPLFEAPLLESLSLRSPRKEPLLRRVDDNRSLDDSTSKSEPISQEYEVAFFSLREHGSIDDVSDPLGRGSGLAKAKRQNHDISGSSSYEIRDITFLDDDTLGVLLGASTSVLSSDGDNSSTSNAGTHYEQFLVSVPLQSPGRPFRPLPALQQLPDSTLGTLPCLLENLSTVPVSVSGCNDGTASCPSSPFTTPVMYTLPIIRSRCVTLSNDVSSIRTEVGVSGTSGNNYSEGSKSIMTHSTDLFPRTEDETGLRVREQELMGPWRVASNERENRSIISVHSITSPEEASSEFSGANKVSVFEL